MHKNTEAPVKKKVSFRPLGTSMFSDKSQPFDPKNSMLFNSEKNKRNNIFQQSCDGSEYKMSQKVLLQAIKDASQYKGIKALAILLKAAKKEKAEFMEK